MGLAFVASSAYANWLSIEIGGESRQLTDNALPSIGHLTAAVDGLRDLEAATDNYPELPPGERAPARRELACEIDPEDKNTVTNLVLLVEVTSASTEEYDRGEKFDHFREIPSLAEYVLVSHRERAIEVRRRDADGSWTVSVAHAGGRVELRSVGCTIDVDALYAGAQEPKG